MKAVLVVGLALMTGVGGKTAPRGLERIPEVRGRTFAGETVALPDALRGRVGVLIVGFSEGARGEVKDWGKAIAADAGRPRELAYYELPMVAGVPKLLRGWVLGKIKEDVSAEGQRHFLPVDDHEREWKDVVGYGAGDEAYVVVVDGSGAVRGRVEGAVTAAAYSEVMRSVRAVGGE